MSRNEKIGWRSTGSSSTRKPDVEPDNLQQTRGKRAILVTSKYHTRRLRVTWNAVADDHYEAVVRYTDRTPFDRDHWWRNSRDVLAVSREMGGILNAWAGFPLYE
jgi:hypothetical protein